MIFGPYLSSVLRLLLPPEYRADLAGAEASLASHDESAAQIVLGKVLLCEGKVNRAREVFIGAEATAGSESDRALAGGYRRLVELADFGACREWGPGPLPLELARRWSPRAWANERDWSYQLPALPPQVEQEVWFVTQIAPLPNEMALAANPDDSKPMYDRLRRANERVSAGELSKEITIGILVINCLIFRLIGQRPDAAKEARNSIEFCRAGKHLVGFGIFALLIYDLVSSARTVPEVLDLYAGDGWLMRGLVEAAEEGPLPDPPEDWTTVLHGKSPARMIFESQAWHLGVGAAQLFSASWITRAKPQDAPATFEIQQLNEARAAFQLANDEAGTQLILTRLLAIMVEQNLPFESDSLQTAREIGVWGRTTGSLAFALGLGLMLLAFARRWRRLGNFSNALNAVRLADALFDGLQASVAKADAATQEAELLADGWELSQAIPSYQRAFDGYVEAVTAMGKVEPGYLDAWIRLRERVAETGAHLLTAPASQDAFARTRQRLVELNILPWMTS